MKANHQPLSESINFTGLGPRDISEWYVITAKNRDKEVSRVLKIQTTGIPDNRDSAVFSEVVRDKNAFLTYIAFLLSDDYLAAFLENMLVNQEQKLPNASYMVIHRGRGGRYAIYHCPSGHYKNES